MAAEGSRTLRVSGVIKLANLGTVRHDILVPLDWFMFDQISVGRLRWARTVKYH